MQLPKLRFNIYQMEDLPSPPAYQPEWDPNYRGPGAAASAPHGEEIELKPVSKMQKAMLLLVHQFF